MKCWLQFGSEYFFPVRENNETQGDTSHSKYLILCPPEDISCHNPLALQMHRLYSYQTDVMGRDKRLLGNGEEENCIRGKRI